MFQSVRVAARWRRGLVQPARVGERLAPTSQPGDPHHTTLHTFMAQSNKVGSKKIKNFSQSKAGENKRTSAISASATCELMCASVVRVPLLSSRAVTRAGAVLNPALSPAGGAEPVLSLHGRSCRSARLYGPFM